MNETLDFLDTHFEHIKDDYQTCRELGIKMAWAHGMGRHARKPLERAMELLPQGRPKKEVVDLYTALGLSYMHLGDDEKATQTLKAGLSLYPDSMVLKSQLLNADFCRADHEAINSTFQDLNSQFKDMAHQQSHKAGTRLTKLLYPSDVACIRFGELASKLDMYIKSRILGLKEDCDAIFLAHSPEPINKALYEYFKKVGDRYITFVEDGEKAEYYKKQFAGAVEHMDYLELPNTRAYQRTFATQTIQRIWDEQNRPPLIKINRKHKKSGNAYLKKVGLNDDDWFVTLHIRSSNTYGDHQNKEEDNNNLVRDSDVADYTDAVKKITEAGGWVIRIGDPNMPVFPKMERVVDYAHDDDRADWLDLFLIANSRFLMCSNSGPAIVATTLGTPIVAINWFPLHAWPYGTKDLMIHKTLRRESDSTCLDLKTCCQYPFGGAHSQTVYKDAGVEVIPNTPEEITEVTKEALATFIHGNFPQASDEEQALYDTYARFSDMAKVGLNARPGRHFLMNHLDLLDAEDDA